MQPNQILKNGKITQLDQINHNFDIAQLNIQTFRLIATESSKYLKNLNKMLICTYVGKKTMIYDDC